MRGIMSGKLLLYGYEMSTKVGPYHIGVDARTGLTHSLSITATNVHDITETENLLHCEESFISANSD